MSWIYGPNMGSSSQKKISQRICGWQSETTELDQQLKQMGGDESDPKSVMSGTAWWRLYQRSSMIMIAAFQEKITLRMMCWMMVIMTMRIIMTKETLRCCTFCSKHLHREKCLTNIYILNPTSVQHKTSFGGYFDVIIITTKNDPVGSLQRKDLKQIDLEN